MLREKGRRKMKRPKKTSAVVIPAAVLVAVMAVGAAYGASNGWDSLLIGRQADGSVLTATGQRVTPAGASVEMPGRPLSMALNPDGQTAVSETWDGNGLFTITDLVNHKVLQQTSPGAGIGSRNVSYGGLLYSPDGKTLWAAQTKNLLKFNVAADGTISNPVAVALPSSGGKDPIPASLVYTSDGQQILASLNGTNQLAVLDAGTGAVIRLISVGNAPRDVVVLGSHAFVANQGGRIAQSGDTTNGSYGTDIVANTENGSPSTGTVSEVDPVTGTIVRTYNVGLEPSALLVHGSDIFVANSNSDTISVLNTSTGEVGQTINANPLPNSPLGSSPNAMTMLDETHLAVSLGTANAVAVYEYKNQTQPASFQGLIPTGWYPGTVQFDKVLGQLVVAAQKGIGSLGVPTTPNAHTVYSDIGLVSTIPSPTDAQMPKYTAEVWQNNQWNAPQTQMAKKGENDKALVAIPRRDGDPSVIKHVFLIVRENRTYDQVLGDDPRGNGDPTLAMFGQKVTPNAHAIAIQGPLLDNTYSSGTMSADGHQWLTQAYVDEYLTRSIGNYHRSYPYNGGDSLAYSATGFLWDNAAHHGVSAKDWGEYTNKWTAGDGSSDSNSWTQWYANTKAIEAGKPATIPQNAFHASTDVPSLSKILQPSYPGFQLQIPDQYRADVFLNDLKTAEQKGSLPQLNLLTIMDDHTAGSNPAFPTPSAQVADNDLALGRIIDGISHSSFGKDSAVFIMEDDSQNGVDHVDGHRNPTLIWSPYAKKGAIVHDFYTQLNVVRTIEQILALPPMTQLDLAAVPMFSAFTDHPDESTYTAIPNQIPLDTMNGTVQASLPTATQPIAKAWSDWSEKQDWRGPDRANPELLNRLDWYSAYDFKRAYPGDGTIFTPDQVIAKTAKSAGVGSDG